MKLNVDGMTCQGCERSVGRVISRQTEQAETDVNVSLEGKTAEFKDVSTDQLAQIIEALTKAGFPAKIAN